MRERWWGASGRRVREIAVEGDADVPLGDAVVVESVDDLDALRKAHESGTPVVVRAESADDVVRALARPEVSVVLVPEERGDLLELDLTKLTYG